jgi:hypothetical protein
MEDTTNYGLVFVSSAMLFLVGTIPLYIINGRLVRNISRLKKQRPSYQRVNTDVDMIMRLDNIEGQMINCKRLIEKNMKKNMPAVASVENMVSTVVISEYKNIKKLNELKFVLLMILIILGRNSIRKCKYYKPELLP